MSEEEKQHINFAQYTQDAHDENYLIGILQRNEKGISKLRPQTLTQILDKLATVQNRMASHVEALEKTQHFNWLR